MEELQLSRHDIEISKPVVRFALELGDCSLDGGAVGVLDVPVGTLKWRVSEARRLVKRKLNR